MIIFWYPRYLYFPSKAPPDPPIHRSTGPPALALAGAVLPPTHTHTYTRTGGKPGVNQSIGQEKKAVGGELDDRFGSAETTTCGETTALGRSQYLYYPDLPLVGTCKRILKTSRYLY